MKLISYIVSYIVCAGLFLVPVFFTYALESGFTVGITIISNDTIAPSVPTNLVLTAVSSSGIDLAWSASSDNIEVSGYKVYRDGVFIATSTVTTYSDIGLVASTVYSYTVSAFDAVYNESSRSSTSTASTLDAPPPNVSSQTQGGSFRRLVVTSEMITPEIDSASFVWTTNVPSVTTVRWGTTPDYELGVIAGTSYQHEHTVQIGDLNASAVYYYQTEFTDQRGFLVIRSGIFYTQGMSDLMPPPNVKNLKISRISADLPPILTWINPPYDIAGVRIVRSLKFYPADRFDGEVIYEGTGQSFTDTMGNEKYFYTVFTYNTQKKYSSGSITRLMPKKTQQAPEKIPPSTTHCMASSTVSASDVYVLQREQKIALNGGIGTVHGTDPLFIFISRDLLCQELKLISATIKRTSGEDNESIMLALQREHGFYEGSLIPPTEPGRYEMYFEFYDFNNNKIFDVSGNFIVEGEFEGNTVTSRIDGHIIFFIVLFLLILLLLFMVIKREKSKKAEK